MLFLFRLNINTMSLSGDSSIQEKMRLGEVKDIWYYGNKTLEKQAIPAVADTRFLQALPSLRQGSSTFIISPKMIGHVFA